MARLIDVGGYEEFWGAKVWRSDYEVTLDHDEILDILTDVVEEVVQCYHVPVHFIDDCTEEEV